MKHFIVIVAFALTVISCGDKKQVQTEATSEIESQPIEESKFSKGADLIAANDCLACHQIDERVVGPSYKQIAAKYSTMDEATLASSIINGGVGNWGEVPMTAHPTLSKDDATEMVRYILSLK